MEFLTESELATLRVILTTKIKNARIKPSIPGNAWADIQRYESILRKLSNQI